MPTPPTQNQIRIIGGKWRSRKLHFPNLPTLRPTPNRVRETLFNWLSPYIVDTSCLDLFAGSGALGFEALSRGARSVVMVDASAAVIQQLRENAALLHAEKEVILYCKSIPLDVSSLEPKAQPFFSAQTAPFDIVFLDPPFHKNYLPGCCAWLENNVLLSKDALIYVEAESSVLDALPIPAHWTILRQKKAGEVGYFLIKIEKS